jgi:hypothetical protein
MSTVEEIVNAAKALPPDQQAELKERLAQLIRIKVDGEAAISDEESQRRLELHTRIHGALYDAGLVADPNPPGKSRRVRRPPITVRGKPVSETIIEDRR